MIPEKRGYTSPTPSDPHPDQLVRDVADLRSSIAHLADRVAKLEAHRVHLADSSADPRPEGAR